MQIAFHIGANCTDDDRLLKSLLKNADVLRKSGIAVPGPSKYRSPIRETIQALGGMPPGPNAGDALLKTILGNDTVDRLVMSHDNFICVPNRVFEGGVFYAQAELKISGLHDLFPQAGIELFIGLRNPATFLQDTYRNSKSPSFQSFLSGLHPTQVRWPNLIERIRHVAADTPLTVWCNEDTPLLWEQLIRAISGVSPDINVTGRFDMLNAILSAEGMRKLLQHVQENPGQTDAQRHETIADLWEEHAKEDQIEEVVEIGALNEQMIIELTEMYEDDLRTIAAIPGVNLILPFT